MSYNSGSMLIFLSIMIIVVFIFLVVVTAIRPKHSDFSRFELERRAEAGDKSAGNSLAREKLLVDVVSIQYIVVAFLIVAITLICVVTFDWLIGVLVGLFVILFYGSIARLGIIRNLSTKLYKSIEKPMLHFIMKAPVIFKILKSELVKDDVHNQRIDSRAELQQLVDSSDNVLTSDEKKLIVHSLSFRDKIVETVMTPRNMIKYIHKAEFLGPLILDDLYKTGHNRLPVISTGIDHIVGILQLDSLLALDVKRSMTAEKAMDPKVFYIRVDQTLHNALAAFLRTHCHIIIVVNKSRETVGLLTLSDVIEALLGRKIIDEFDSHDDLRSVASRNL